MTAFASLSKVIATVAAACVGGLYAHKVLPQDGLWVAVRVRWRCETKPMVPHSMERLSAAARSR